MKSQIKNGSNLIPGTTWTYFDAASMAKEVNREARLFPNHRNPVPMPRRSSMTRSASFKAKFLRETGWNWTDAVDEALKSVGHHRPSPLHLGSTR